MMITSLFAELSEIEQKSINHDLNTDAEMLTKLDEDYDECWDRIFSFEPQSSDLAELMMILLLDKLVQYASEGQSVSQIKEKILSLHQTTGSGKHELPKGAAKALHQNALQ